jgi:hypothetical protein
MGRHPDSFFRWGVFGEVILKKSKGQKMRSNPRIAAVSEKYQIKRKGKN